MSLNSYSLYCIIRNSSDGKLLLASTSVEWHLPTVIQPAIPAVDVCDTAAIGLLVTRALHQQVRILYAMTLRTDPYALVVAGEMDDAQVGAGQCWYEPEAAIACLRNPLQQTLLTAYQQQLRYLSQREIMPWMGQSMYHTISQWICTQLNTPSVTLPAPPQHVNASFRGTVLRVRTTQETLFFKAEPRIFFREIPIMATLSSWQLPGIPQPILLDEEQRWMVTREVDGPTLAESDDVTVWEETLRQYARLQQMALAHLARTNDTHPFYDRQPASVASELERIPDELDMLLAGHPDALSVAECQGFRECVPRAIALCEEIAAYPVPDTLEHGDLHPANIRLTTNGPVILDWAWSSIAPPFHSLSLLLHEKRLPSALLPLRAHLRQVYLREWSAYATESRLTKLADLVQRWRDVEYAVGDAAWVRAYLNAYPQEAFIPHSYLEWTLRMRQHYLIKVLRRLIEFFIAPAMGKSEQPTNRALIS